MSIVEILNTATVCRNFPDPASGEVFRDDLIKTIDNYINQDYPVIYVEGASGAGKTTLLRQFHLENLDHCVSLFINPDVSYFMNQDYIKNIICEQICIIVGRDYAKDISINSILMDAQRQVKMRGKKLVFIIDGAEKYPEEKIKNLSEIIYGLIPVGLSEFRFLVSKLDRIEIDIFNTVKLTKTITITQLSKSNVKIMLQSLNIENEIMEDIYNISEGIPGRVASIRRMMENGVKIDNIINRQIETLEDLINLEWLNLNNLDENSKIMLAVLANAKFNLDVQVLSMITSLPLEDIRNMIIQNKLIRENSSGVVEFVSSSHKKLIKNRLTSYEKRSLKYIIDYLIKCGDSEDRTAQIPLYYTQAKMQNELLSYVDLNYFTDVVNTSSALYPINDTLNTVIDISRKQNYYDKLLKYSLVRSAINSMTVSTISEDELRAMLVRKDYESAAIYIDSQKMQEDRLYFYSFLVSYMKINEGVIRYDLIDRINNIIDQIDLSKVPVVLLRVAVNLAIVDIKIAMNIMEKVFSSIEDNEDVVSRREDDQKTQKKNEEELEATERNNTGSALEYLYALANTMDSDKTMEFLEYIKSTDLKKKFPLLRSWIMANKERDDIIDIIDYALDVLMEESMDYRPTLEDFLVICTPLEHQKITHLLPHIVDRIDRQVGTIIDRDSGVLYYKLLVRICNIENRFDVDKAETRLLDVFYKSVEIIDLSFRSEIFSYILGNLNIELLNFIDKKFDISREIKQYLDASIKNIIANCAEHHELLKKPLEYLSRYDENMAFGYISNVNTQIRRDLLIDNCLTSLSQIGDIKKIAKFVKNIYDHDLKDKSIDKCMREICKKEIIRERNDLYSLFQIIIEMSELDSKIKNLARLYKTIFKHENCQEIAYRIEAALRELHKHINNPWARLNTLFYVSRISYKINPDLSDYFFSEAISLKKSLAIKNEDQAKILARKLVLLNKSFQGLCEVGEDKREDLDNIIHMIEKFPSVGDRLIIFSDLSLRMLESSRKDISDYVVDKFIIPNIRDIDREDRFYFRRIIERMIPAIFKFNNSLAFQIIENEIHTSLKNDIYMSICRFIIRGKSFVEPVIDDYRKSLSYVDVLDLCAVLENVDCDSEIMNVVEDISESIYKDRDNFTKQHIAEIYRKLDSLIERKIPDKRNIQHEGYAILYDIFKAKNSYDINVLEVDKLKIKIQNISNISDRIYLFSELITAINKNKLYDAKKQIVEETHLMFKDVPSSYDRISRLLIFAEKIKTFNVGKSKEILKNALKYSISCEENHNVIEFNKKIIDLAYKIDPSFAETLINAYDEDQARVKKRSNIKSLYEEKIIRHQIHNKTHEEIDEKEIAKHDIGNIAYDSLSKLNCNRVRTMPVGEVASYLKYCNPHDFDDIYKVSAWIIHNTYLKTKLMKDKTIMRELYNSVKDGVEIGFIMTDYSNYNFEGNNIMKPGDRGKAVEIISDWIRDNLSEYIKICDPYFNEDELSIFKTIQEIDSTVKISVLTSISAQSDLSNSDDVYNSKWRFEISDNDPPNNEIVIAGIKIKNNVSPIHDRWIITKNAGMRIGTSFGSVGLSKISEISTISSENLREYEASIDKFIIGRIRNFEGDKIDYKIVIIN